MSAQPHSRRSEHPILKWLGVAPFALFALLFLILAKDVRTRLFKSAVAVPLRS